QGARDRPVLRPPARPRSGLRRDARAEAVDRNRREHVPEEGGAVSASLLTDTRQFLNCSRVTHGLRLRLPLHELPCVQTGERREGKYVPLKVFMALRVIFRRVTDWKTFPPIDSILALPLSSELVTNSQCMGTGAGLPAERRISRCASSLAWLSMPAALSRV